MNQQISRRSVAHYGASSLRGPVHQSLEAWVATQRVEGRVDLEPAG